MRICSSQLLPTCEALAEDFHWLTRRQILLERVEFRKGIVLRFASESVFHLRSTCPEQFSTAAESHLRALRTARLQKSATNGFWLNHLPRRPIGRYAASIRG
jgi:hypothetical protein